MNQIFKLASLLVTCFLSTTTSAFESSTVLTEAKISIRPVLEKNGFLLVEAKGSEEKIEDVFLAGDDAEPIPLQKLEQKPIKESGVYDTPGLFWKFTYPKQKSKRNGAFFALVGKETPTAVEFYSRYRLGGSGPVPDCALAASGFITDRVRDYVVNDRKKNRELKITYAHSRLLNSTYKKMDSKSQQSGEWFRERILFENKDGTCRELAQMRKDGDGMLIDKGHPIGDVIGILFLNKAEKREAWVAVEGHGYESYGLTFLQAPLTPGQKLGVAHFLIGGL